MGFQAFTLPHGDGIIAFMFRNNNAVGVVDNPVADGVGKRRFTDFLVPAANIELILIPYKYIYEYIKI